MSAPAYLIATMHVSDPERYQQYMVASPAAVQAAGGEFIARGGRHETIEGDWRPHRVVMVRFPSYEQAKAFYERGPYASDVRPLRQGATEYFNMVLVEGVAAPA